MSWNGVTPAWALAGVDNADCRVWLGDCLKLLKDLPDKSVDMILTDLPYGSTNCKWDSPIPLKLLWAEYRRVAKPTAAILLFGTEPFASHLRLWAPDLYRYDWVWKKRLPVGFLNAKKMPLRAHENVLVFYKKLPKYRPQKTSGHARKTATRKTTSELYGKADKTVTYDSTDRYPVDVVEFGTDKHLNPIHPTQKPLELLRYLIRTYTDAGDLVLDSCFGSGSTAVAALEEGRRFVGMELDEPMFDKACARISECVIRLNATPGRAIIEALARK